TPPRWSMPPASYCWSGTPVSAPVSRPSTRSAADSILPEPAPSPVCTKDDLIPSEPAGVRGQGALLQHSIVGVILHAGHEPHSLLRQLPEPFVIGVAAIEHQHRLRLKPHLACHPDLMHLSLRDHRIRRQIALMIEQQMQLDRALGLFEPGPIENFGAQIDHCRVQTYQ